MPRPSEPVRVTCFVWRLGGSGGVPQFQRDLALAVATQPDIQLTIVSARGRGDDDVDAVERVADVEFLDVAGRSLRDRAAMISGVRRHVRDRRPDVLHLHSGTGWIALAALLPFVRRRPEVVLQVHDPPQTRRQSAASDRLERLACRWLGWHAVADSRGAATEIAAAWRRPIADVTVAPLGIDTERFRPTVDGRAKVRAELGVGDDTAVVMTVARLVPSKRVDRFVRLAATQPAGVCFVAIGEGPERAALERLAAGTSADVRLVGLVDDLTEWLAAADVAVSTSEAEGFGLFVAEAMSCCLPVVAHDTAGFDDLIEPGVTGLTCPQDDVDGIGDLLAQLLHDPVRRAEMGAEARRRVEELFSLAAMGRTYAELWATVSDRTTDA